MTETKRWRQHYNHIAPFLIIAIGVLAATGIWVGASAAIVNGRQDQANAALLDCLNSYAATNAVSNKEVREATVAKDVATTDRDVALAELSELLQIENPTPARVDSAVTEFNRTSVALVEAQDNLDQARENNPVLPPPKIYCDIEV